VHPRARQGGNEQRAHQSRRSACSTLSLPFAVLDNRPVLAKALLIFPLAVALLQLLLCVF
jgi:hypothetical protein